MEHSDNLSYWVWRERCFHLCIGGHTTNVSSRPSRPSRPHPSPPTPALTPPPTLPLTPPLPACTPHPCTPTSTHPQLTTLHHPLSLKAGVKGGTCEHPKRQMTKAANLWRIWCDAAAGDRGQHLAHQHAAASAQASTPGETWPANSKYSPNDSDSKISNGVSGHFMVHGDADGEFLQFFFSPHAHHTPIIDIYTTTTAQYTHHTPTIHPL